MEKDTITIGRSKDCDVRIDSQYDTVSNRHAEIRRNGSGLQFVEHSSNGSLVNGKKVHNTTIDIYPGDQIKLAGTYELTWAVINKYFPALDAPTRMDPRLTARRDRPTEQFYPGRSEETELGPERHSSYDAPREPVQHGYQNHDNNYGQENAYSQAEIHKYLDKWNWGAFFCTWLWGVFNRIYWPLITILCAFIPYIGQIANIVIMVYLGMKGNRLAWNKGNYRDFADFKRSQHTWAIIGIVVFVVNVVLVGFGTAYMLNQF